MRYKKPYDDNYTLLACHLVSVLSVDSLKKVLTNDIFVFRMVIDEAKNLEIGGPFLDCIDEAVVRKEHTKKKNACLKALGEYYFSELDLPRLREEVKKFAKEMGVNLE